MPEETQPKQTPADVASPETTLDDPTPAEMQPPAAPPAPEPAAPPEPAIAKPPEEATAGPQIVVHPDGVGSAKPSSDFGTKQLILLIIVTMVVAAIAGGLAFLLIV